MVEHEVLWRPSQRIGVPASELPLERFKALVEQRTGRRFKGDQELWKWSVEDIQGFWALLWEFAAIKHSRTYTSVLEQGIAMPDVPKFFIGSTLNYAENLLQGEPHKGLNDQVAVVNVREGGTEAREMTWKELRREVARIAFALRASGLRPLDRIATITSNSLECILIFLASSSLGCIFSSISSDMGEQGILSRLEQIRPKLILADNAVRYNGKLVDQREKLAKVLESLHASSEKEGEKPRMVVIPNVPSSDLSLPTTLPFESSWTTLPLFLSSTPSSVAPQPQYTQLPFSHPLMIVFSSGTTGEPKCIVHSAGGVLLQARKEGLLHFGYSERDTLLQYTTTGWIMHSMLVSALSSGLRIIVYDGSPLLPLSALPSTLAQYRVTHFGTSPRYLAELQRQGYSPIKEKYDLSALRLVTSTGSLLSGPVAKGFYATWPKDICLMSISGGTDIAACFVSGTLSLPVYAGKISTRCFGMAVKAFDEEGRESGEEGELVCTKPFPSMPITFWGPRGKEIYRSSYYDKYPLAWSQGDFVQIDERTGAVVMLGRSDGVLNPSGVRFGSSDIYSVVDRFDEILDSLCVGQRRAQDNDERVILFVKLREGRELNEDLLGRLRKGIREGFSARHVPAAVFEVEEIPVTFNGKKVEIAVKKLISKGEVKVSSAIANPEVLRSYRRFFDFEEQLEMQKRKQRKEKL